MSQSTRVSYLVKPRPASRAQLKKALAVAQKEYGQPEVSITAPKSGGGGTDSAARKSAKDNAATIGSHAEVLETVETRLRTIENALTAPAPPIGG